MRVICIDEPNALKGNEHVPNPKEGDIDEVISEGIDSDIGEYYKLQRFGRRFIYSKCHFAPISDIDETEMIRNYQTQTA